MANETELERLVIRLIGDVSGLVKSLKVAEIETKNTAKVVEDQSKKIEGFKNAVAGYGASIVDVAKGAAAAFATFGISTAIMSAYNAFEQADLGAKRLAMTIEMNGGSVKETMGEYKKFADEMARVTTSGKGATFQLLQQAQMMGLNAAQTEAATKNAIALAAQTGGDASSYIRQTGLLEKGYVNRGLAMQLGMPMKQTAAAAHEAAVAFDEMGNAIEPMEKDAAKAADAHARLAKMFKMAELAGQTTDAQLARMKRTFTGLTKDIGAMVADGIKPAVSWLERAVVWFNSLDPTVRKTAVAIAAASGAIISIATIAPTVIAALASIKAAAMSLWSATSTNPWANLAMGIAVGYALGRAIYELNGDVQKLNASMEESASIGERVAQQRQDQIKRILGAMEGMSPFEQENYLRQQVDRTKTDIQRYVSMIEEAQKRVKEASRTKSDFLPWWMDPMGTQGPVIGLAMDKILPNAPLDAVKDQVKQHQAALDDARKALKTYEDELLQLGQIRLDQKLVKDINDLNKKLEEQVATFGMSAQEIEIWKLKMAGATDAQLQHAKAAQWAIKFLTDQQKKFEDLQQEQKHLMDLGKQMAREVATPFEVLQDKLAEIDKVFAAGGLNMDTYFRAIEKAQEDFRKATDGSKDAVHALANDMSRLNAALFGSAEAISRVRAYQDTLAKRGDLPANNAPQQKNAPNANPEAKPMLDVLKEIRDAIKDKDKKPGLFNLRIGAL